MLLTCHRFFGLVLSLFLAYFLAYEEGFVREGRTQQCGVIWGGKTEKAVEEESRMWRASIPNVALYHYFFPHCFWTIVFSPIMFGFTVQMGTGTVFRYFSRRKARKKRSRIRILRTVAGLCRKCRRSGIILKAKQRRRLKYVIPKICFLDWFDLSKFNELTFFRKKFIPRDGIILLSIVDLGILWDFSSFQKETKKKPKKSSDEEDLTSDGSLEEKQPKKASKKASVWLRMFRVTSRRIWWKSLCPPPPPRHAFRLFSPMLLSFCHIPRYFCLFLTIFSQVKSKKKKKMSSDEGSDASGGSSDEDQPKKGAKKNAVRATTVFILSFASFKI